MQDQPIVKKEKRNALTIATEWAAKLTRKDKEYLAERLAALIDKDKAAERADLQARLDDLK